MTDNRKRMINGLAVAAGAVGAYFAMRALLNWRQRREADARYYARYLNNIRDQQEARETSAEGMQTEVRWVESTRYQPRTQPDRETIPATGAPVLEEIDIVSVGIDMPVTADELATPLAQYLIIFHDMVHQLHLRHWEEKTEGVVVASRRSLNPTDRARFQELLDRLSRRMPEVSDDDFTDDSLELRMYNLIVKAREAMLNLTYTDDDLFRIDGEIRTQACQVLNEILVAGDEVREARQIYECG